MGEGGDSHGEEETNSEETDSEETDSDDTGTDDGGEDEEDAVGGEQEEGEAAKEDSDDNDDAGVSRGDGEAAGGAAVSDPYAMGPNTLSPHVAAGIFSTGADVDGGGFAFAFNFDSVAPSLPLPRCEDVGRPRRRGEGKEGSA